MTDTLWADISEFQSVVTSAYPHRIIAIRSNDGSYRDHNFTENRHWCDQAVASGRLAGYIVYYYWRPGGTGYATLREMVGTPGRKMAVMIDCESGGNPYSDQSHELNMEAFEIDHWLGYSRSRVIGYGNPGDLNTMWSTKPWPGFRFVIAAYDSNPDYPGKFAHQYANNGYCPPFGRCDANSADGMTEGQVLGLLGI